MVECMAKSGTVICKKSRYGNLTTECNDSDVQLVLNLSPKSNRIYNDSGKVKSSRYAP